MSDQNGYDYDAMNVVEEVEGLAEVRLSGPFTLELTAWDDGDFQVQAFHTIDATYPFEAEANDEEHGLPFYRERLRFPTVGDSEGWLLHEVVRAFCGETREEVVYSERVGGYTPDWPVPLLDGDDEDGEGDGRTVEDNVREATKRGPRYRYPGRFA